MSVYATLGVLKGFLRSKSKADISNATFYLHRMTAVLLLACSILTTSRQYFGDPIHCASPGRIPLPMFQSYCFMTGTYTINRSREMSVELAHPGVGPGDGPSDPRNTFHTYYQWVCLLLVLQAAASYLPYHVWKIIEGGRVSRLMVKVSNDLITETSLTDQVSGLANFIYRNSGWFNPCSLKLLVCQMGCLLSIVMQMYLMDQVLDNQYLGLGSCLSDIPRLQTALTIVFPKVVKCSMNSYGPSGNIVPQHGICTLPINVVNEKIYLVLWIWYIILTLVTILQLIYSLLLLFVPCLRFHQLRSLCPHLHPRLVRHVVTRSTYGDLVLLQLVAANCDIAQFTTLITKLVHKDDVLEDVGVESLDNFYGSRELGLGLPRTKTI